MPQLNVFFLSPFNALSAPSSNEGASVGPGNSPGNNPTPGEFSKCWLCFRPFGGHLGDRKGSLQPESDIALWKVQGGYCNAQVQVWGGNLDFFNFCFPNSKNFSRFWGEMCKGKWSWDMTITWQQDTLMRPCLRSLLRGRAKVSVDQV